MNDYETPAQCLSHEVMVRKSRFIGYAACTPSLAARGKLLQKLRTGYADASHVCHASRIGSPSDGQLLSDDDGEPNGTAGRPILNVIEHSAIGDITIAVIRYFGGIKLGAGGLVRAYSGAASGVIQTLPLKQKVTLLSVQIICEFALEAQLRKCIADAGGIDVTPYYDAALTLHFSLPAATLDDTRTRVDSLTRGKAKLIVQ